MQEKQQQQQQQYRSSKPQPESVNLLTPRSDQYETSPSDILTLSSKQLMRIFKLIGEKLLSWSNDNFS